MPTDSPIPGARYRLFAGPADYPGMVRANMAARRADGIVETVTVEGMTNDYANLTNSDPYRDVIIAEVDGEIVGYGRVNWADDNEGGRSYVSFCLFEPDARRRGLGRPMLRWQEARLRQIAAGHDTDRPKFLHTFAYDRDAGAHALLQSEGFEVIRIEAEMVRPDLEAIPDVPAPAGIELRLGCPEDARAAWEANVEIFRDHWGTLDESEESYRRIVDAPYFDPSQWVLAWAGEEIAGLVFTSTHAPSETGAVLGYLDSVGVRRPWRQIGLGRALVAASLRLLRDRGATMAGLGVDLQNDNRASHLYESVGFAIESTSRSYRKPLLPGPPLTGR